MKLFIFLGLLVAGPAIAADPATMNEITELIQIFIHDDSRMLCQFAGQLAWVIFPITLKWKTDKLVTAGCIKARCVPPYGRQGPTALIRKKVILMRYHFALSRLG